MSTKPTEQRRPTIVADPHNTENKDSNIPSIFNTDMLENASEGKDTMEAHIPHIPLWGLPKDVQQVATGYADMYQVPTEFIIAGIMAAASAVAGNRIKSKDGTTSSSATYTNTSCLWIAVVARSGANKSTPINAILKPVHELNAEMDNLYQCELNAWRAVKTESKQYSEQKPYPKQIILSDTTAEARNEVLKNNPDGVLQYTDELSTTIMNMNRYCKSGEESQMLSIYDGRDFSVNRASKDYMNIKEPFMSILGTIQPAVLASQFSMQQQTNGYMFRFMFIYPEDSDIPYLEDHPISQVWVQKWNSLIRSIKKRNAETIYYTEDALRLMREYHDHVTDLINDTDIDFLRSAYSKLNIFVQRWAVTVSILNESHQITSDIFRYSVECMGYFEHTIRKVYILLTGQEAKSKQELTNKELIVMLLDRFPQLRDKMPKLAKMMGKPDNYVRRNYPKSKHKSNVRGTEEQSTDNEEDTNILTVPVSGTQLPISFN